MTRGLVAVLAVHAEGSRLYAKQLHYFCVEDA